MIGDCAARSGAATKATLGRQTCWFETFMTSKVLIAGADWSLSELKDFLLENSITGAPVVDGKGKLVGVISATDLLRSEEGEESLASDANGYFSTTLHRSLSKEEMRQLHVQAGSPQTVRDVMTPVVFQVDADTPVDEVADQMVRGRVHRVIVTRGGAVIGIVAALDLVKALRDLLRKKD